MLQRAKGGEYVGVRVNERTFRTCGNSDVTIEDGDRIVEVAEKCRNGTPLPDPGFKDLDPAGMSGRE